MHALAATTRRRAAAAIGIASVLLDADEQVAGLVCGQYLGHDGIAVLTGRRVLCVNDRTLAPDHDSVDLTQLASVEGWVEAGRATLRIADADEVLVIGEIREVDAAQEFARILRTNL